MVSPSTSSVQGLAEGTRVKEKTQDYTKANMHQKPGCAWNVGKGLKWLELQLPHL